MYHNHKRTFSKVESMSAEHVDLNQNQEDYRVLLDDLNSSLSFFPSFLPPHLVNKVKLLKPYRNMSGECLFNILNNFPSGNEKEDFIVARHVFIALATSPSIDIILDDDSVVDVMRMQQLFEGDNFDKYINWCEFSSAINNGYAEAVRQLLSISASYFDGRPIRLSLEKAVISNEAHLIGYEIEMGANFRVRELPPHFVLAESTSSPNLGWPALSFQIDRMPGRAPQIELVTGPLDRETRKSGDYYHAIATAKLHIAGSNNFEEFVGKYNNDVGGNFHINFSPEALSFINAGGDLSYDLVLPGKPELIARNVQTTVQIPYSAFAKEDLALDRLFSNDSELTKLLLETRDMADRLMSEKMLSSCVDNSTDYSKAVFVHTFFELLANLAVGRNEYYDFKSRAPFIIRTSPEVIAPYICSPHDRKQLQIMFADRGMLVKWILQTLSTHANNRQSRKFLDVAGSINVRELVDSKLGLIEQRLALANKIDNNYLVTRSGGVPATNGGVSFIRPEMRQTLSLPPTVCKGKLYIAVELRNRPAFAAFHRSYAGIAPIRR